MVGSTSAIPSPHPPESIACSADAGFAHWLASSGGTLAVTTYQAGKLLFLSAEGLQVNVLMRHFDKPMGFAFAHGKLALATRHDITFFADAPALAPTLHEDRPGIYDALYLARATHHTGDLNVHDIAFGDDGLWLAATRFSCLAHVSRELSFLPMWRPKFVSDTVPEDRCHLNGLALVDGKPKYVTALGETDTPCGWRPAKADGGLVIDVVANEIVVRGLSMPHSPRWNDGRLWVLSSGAGELCEVDLGGGKARVVTALPAYLRGLTFIGEHAIVGLCQIREKHIFGNLPVQQRHERLLSGLAVIHLTSGNQVGVLEFTSGCQEIFEVQFLPRVRRPNLLQFDRPEARQAFTAPEFSYWLRPSHELPPPPGA
jgi:uncharacterized protein (TIGR03032 family)